MSVLEKMLVPDLGRRIVEFGLDWLGGAVYRPEDLVGLTPSERIAAHWMDAAELPGTPFDPDPDFVDVVRFVTNPLMVLRVPTYTEGEPLPPWPTYPLGFLRNAAAVWNLQLTRVPTYSRYVRIRRDGSESVLSEYEGPAHGWRNGTGFLPPHHLVGPRARWRGIEMPCSYTADQQSVELAWVGDEGAPEGFVHTCPLTWSRVVSLAECEEVFDIALVGSWNGLTARVVQPAGDECLILFSPRSVEEAEALGALQVEPGLYQAVVPTSELGEVSGVRTDPAPGRG